jgi:hypothetical protein
MILLHHRGEVVLHPLSLESDDAKREFGFVRAGRADVSRLAFPQNYGSD